MGGQKPSASGRLVCSQISDTAGHCTALSLWESGHILFICSSVVSGLPECDLLYHLQSYTDLLRSMSDIMGAGPLQIVAWTVPMGVGGLILATAGGLIMHKVSGTILMLISCIGYAGSGLFFAVIPKGGIYWGFVFPAMICGTVGIDISFNIANVFITTHLPKAKQGLAGALINCTLHFGIAIFLGFADIVKSETEHLGQFKSFKAVFWFETALALVGALIVVFFVRIHHAKSDLTVEERAALTAESRNT